MTSEIIRFIGTYARCPNLVNRDDYWCPNIVNKAHVSLSDTTVLNYGCVICKQLWKQKQNMVFYEANITAPYHGCPSTNDKYANREVKCERTKRWMYYPNPGVSTRGLVCQSCREPIARLLQLANNTPMYCVLSANSRIDLAINKRSIQLADNLSRLSHQLCVRILAALRAKNTDVARLIIACFLTRLTID